MTEIKIKFNDYNDGKGVIVNEEKIAEKGIESSHTIGGEKYQQVLDNTFSVIESKINDENGKSEQAREMLASIKTEFQVEGVIEIEKDNKEDIQNVVIARVKKTVRQLDKKNPTRKLLLLAIKNVFEPDEKNDNSEVQELKLKKEIQNKITNILASRLKEELFKREILNAHGKEFLNAELFYMASLLGADIIADEQLQEQMLKSQKTGEEFVLSDYYNGRFGESCAQADLNKLVFQSFACNSIEREIALLKKEAEKTPSLKVKQVDFDERKNISDSFLGELAHLSKVEENFLNARKNNSRSGLSSEQTDEITVLAEAFARENLVTAEGDQDLINKEHLKDDKAHLVEQFKSAAEKFEEISADKFIQQYGFMEPLYERDLKALIERNINHIHEDHVDVLSPKEQEEWEFAQAMVKEVNIPSDTKKYFIVEGKTFVVDEDKEKTHEVDEEDAEQKFDTVASEGYSSGVVESKEEENKFAELPEKVIKEFQKSAKSVWDFYEDKLAGYLSQFSTEAKKKQFVKMLVDPVLSEIIDDKEEFLVKYGFSLEKKDQFIELILEEIAKEK